MRGLLIALIISLAVTPSLTLDCTEVVTKIQEGVLNWLGNLDFTVPVSTTTGWALTLFFDQEFTGVGVWDGWVEYNGTAKWAIITNRNISDAVLEEGERKSLNFRINYGQFIPQPQLISFRFQDIELCN